MIAEITFFLVVIFLLGQTIRKLDVGGYAGETLVRMMFGICVFPIVAIALGFFGIMTPMWAIIVSAVLFVFFSKFSEYRIIRLGLDKYMLICFVLATVMFLAFTAVYETQFLLEDGDPNGHAEAISYIANYHTFLKPVNLFITRYIEPYPVGFQAWMGILSQLGEKVPVVMGYFNMVFVALTIPAIYLFVSEISGDPRLGMFSAVSAFMLPTFLTRFIFSEPLAVLQMVMTFYFVARCLKKGDSPVYAGLLMGSVMLTHQTTAVVMGGLFLLWFVFDLFIKTFVEKSGYLSLDDRFIRIVVIALLIAVPWWGYEFNKYGWEKVKYQLNLGRLGETAFGLSDPSMNYYTLWDFAGSKVDNDIANMVGMGYAAFILMIIGVLYSIKDLKTYKGVMLLWLAVTVGGVFSNWLPISFIPSRMWAFMSIPAVFFIGVALSRFYDIKANERAFFILGVGGLLLTSMVPKFELNMVPWGSARFHTEDEYKMARFVYDSNDTKKLFDGCMYERVWALGKWDDPMDMYALSIKNSNVNTSIYGWDSEGWLKLVNVSDSRFLSSDPYSLHGMLVGQRYDHLIMGSKCMKMAGWGSDQLKARVDNMTASGMFSVAYKSGDEYVIKIAENVFEVKE